LQQSVKVSQQFRQTTVTFNYREETLSDTSIMNGRVERLLKIMYIWSLPKAIFLSCNAIPDYTKWWHHC